MPKIIKNMSCYEVKEDTVTKQESRVALKLKEAMDKTLMKNRVKVKHQ